MFNLENNNYKSTYHAKMQGAVMITGLMILLVLGVVGTSSLNNVNTLERMVSNIHDANRAYQGAEAALHVCEQFLGGLDVAYEEKLMAGQIHQDDADDADIQHWQETAGPLDRWWNNRSFWNDHGVAVNTLGLSDSNRPGRLFADPRCLNQHIVGARTMIMDAETGEPTDTETNAADFTVKYANVENLMADQSGDAAMTGGIYHFRVTATSAGLATRSNSEGHSEGRSRVVMQSDFFTRLN